MVDKNKLAVNSKAGEKLVTVSTVVLIFGFIAALIIFITAFHEESGLYRSEVVFDWGALALAIEILFGSIFVYVFGNTVASIANHIEAIYKNQNPDYKYDSYIARGYKFFPGDKALYKPEMPGVEGAKEQEVTVKDIIDEDGYIYYLITLPDGSEIKVRNYYLRDKED